MYWMNFPKKKIWICCKTPCQLWSLCFPRQQFEMLIRFRLDSFDPSYVNFWPCCTKYLNVQKVEFCRKYHSHTITWFWQTKRQFNYIFILDFNTIKQDILTMFDIIYANFLSGFLFPSPKGVLICLNITWWW